MICLGFSRFLSGLDLNFDSMTYGLLRLHAKDPHEPRQACFLSTHGLLAIEHFSPMRSDSPWRSQGPGNNGVLALDMRAPLVGYALRRWSVDCSTEHGLDPKEHHLWLKNSQTLYGVESAALAPGYAIKGGDLE